MSPCRLFDRAVLRISPRNESENVLAFLQGLVTNDVTGKLPAYAGLLSPQGKTLFDFIVWPSGSGVLIDCEANGAEELAKRLSLYRLRREIDIEIDDSRGVYWQKELGDGGAPDPRLADLGQRWIAPVSESDESADANWTKHRLRLGIPEGRAEMSDILWLETNAAELNGVSFSKGCFIGQENTARMNWRQKVNRRLVVVPLEKSDEKRRKAVHEELGLAVDHLRIGDIEPAILPEWQKAALSAPEQSD